MIWTVVRIGIVVAILALLLSRVDMRALGGTLAGADPALVAAGVVVSFLLPVLTALRWRRACRIARIDGPFREHMAIQWIAGFVGQVLPSNVGVEGMRIWLYARRIGGVGAAVSGVWLIHLLLTIRTGRPIVRSPSLAPLDTRYHIVRRVTVSRSPCRLAVRRRWPLRYSL